MAIVAADIKFRYSGGAANTSAAASLGGIMSTDAGGTIDDNVANDLFDNVSSAESAAGDTEYRGFYVENGHGTLALQNARVYVSADTTSATEELDIAIADEDVDVTMETIANESTAPTGPTFSHPTTYAAGLNLNTGTPATGLVAGSQRGVWIRRVVNSGTAAVTANTGTIKAEGDTAG